MKMEQEVVDMIFSHFPRLNRVVTSLLLEESEHEDLFLQMSPTVLKNPVEVLKAIELVNYGRFVTFLIMMMIYMRKGKLSMASFREITTHLVREVKIYNISLDLPEFQVKGKKKFSWYFMFWVRFGLSTLSFLMIEVNKMKTNF